MLTPAESVGTVTVAAVVPVPAPPPPPAAVVVVVVVLEEAVTVKVFDVVRSDSTGELTVAVSVYDPAEFPVIVKALLTSEFPEIDVLPTDDGLQERPDGHEIEMLNVVEEPPALLTPTVSVLVLPDVTLLDESEEDAVRLAGVRTTVPACSVSEREPPVPESVALTLAVIPLV